MAQLSQKTRVLSHESSFSPLVWFWGKKIPPVERLAFSVCLFVFEQGRKDFFQIQRRPPRLGFWLLKNGVLSSWVLPCTGNPKTASQKKIWKFQLKWFFDATLGEFLQNFLLHTWWKFHRLRPKAKEVTSYAHHFTMMWGSAKNKQETKNSLLCPARDRSLQFPSEWQH